MPPLLADFIHARACKPICEKPLTLPIFHFVRILDHAVQFPAGIPGGLLHMGQYPFQLFKHSHRLILFFRGTIWFSRFPENRALSLYHIFGQSTNPSQFPTLMDTKIRTGSIYLRFGKEGFMSCDGVNKRKSSQNLEHFKAPVWFE